MHTLTGTEDMTHGYWWYDPRVMHILTGTAYSLYRVDLRDNVWAFHHWADPLTVFCFMRQDCAHWNEQIWPLNDGLGLQLVYSWDNDVDLEISFIFFATMFMPRAWRDLFSTKSRHRNRNHSLVSDKMLCKSWVVYIHLRTSSTFKFSSSELNKFTSSKE